MVMVEMQRDRRLWARWSWTEGGGREDEEAFAGVKDKRGGIGELEPDEREWPLLKAHLLAYNREIELARRGFNELLKIDPFRVEAYHGLATAASQEESSEELEKIEKKVEEAMKLCKKENRKSDLRDFKLLFAQIRVIEGNYDEALKVYEELVREEPRDFRPI
ncbi:unnamed protein product [Fraxinus pennsylvanica]|uniref:Uncharacterized protein n=1 Tax=Fraxinus pennsylvanica TaxID=56036 RepID=A0AAD2A0S2_9LAMI|nr:unnamed protein product [Fraxinus pennsylvanica]